MSTERPWRAILEGAARERALAVVDAVAADLLRPPAAWIPAETAEPFRRRRGASLARGAAGLAVFYGYLACAGRRPADRNPLVVAETFLDIAGDVLAELSMPPSLYGGFGGVAWAGEHLRRLVEDEADPEADPEDDPNDELDAALARALETAPGFDLWNGVVGLGVYALERLPRPSARELAGKVVRCLGERAERSATGASWRTLPAALPDRLRAVYPRGFDHLGLAHGLAGVIVFLARTVRAGIAVEASRPLLAAAVARLLANRREPRDATEGLYPSRLAADGTPVGRISAWCQGDPGIAVAFCLAGHLADEPAWTAEGLTVARHAAARLDDPAAVVDAGLCHGAAGLGHLFHRLARMTGDATLAAAARSWLERALEHRRADGEPGHGPGGFAAWGYGPDGDLCHLHDPGLIQGSAGVALALLAGATDVEPAWDRMMLLSAG